MAGKSARVILSGARRSTAKRCSAACGSTELTSNERVQSKTISALACRIKSSVPDGKSLFQIRLKQPQYAISVHTIEKCRSGHRNSVCPESLLAGKLELGIYATEIAADPRIDDADNSSGDKRSLPIGIASKPDRGSDR